LVDGRIEPLTYSAEQVMRRLKEDDIKFLDLQFTGLFGRFHHTTIDSKMFRANVKHFHETPAVLQKKQKGIL
jgi:glutamine synthetase